MSGSEAGPGAQRLSAAVRGLGMALDVVLALLLLSVLAIATCQMALRYFASTALLWGEEASVILMVWFVAFGTGRVWLLDGHIGVPLMPDAMPRGARQAWLSIFDLIAVAAGIVLVLAAQPLVAIYANIVLDTLPVSAAWKYGALIGAGGLLAICALLRLGARLLDPKDATA